MAWAHFTAPLAPGDDLTAAMRDELYAAFNERYLATAANDYTAAVAEVQATDLLTSRITSVSLFERLESLLGYYSDSFLEWSPWGTTSWRAAIASTLGVTSTELINTVGVTARQNSATYWNIIREGIRLLSICRVDHTSGDWQEYEKRVSLVSGGWAAAKAAFYADVEALQGAFFTLTLNVTEQLGSGERYTIFARRRDYEINIPAISPFSAGYNLALFYSDGGATSEPPLEHRVVFGATTTDFAMPAMSNSKYKVSLGALTATGTDAVAFEAAALAYYDEPALDRFQPPLNTAYQQASTILIAAEPTFTHP